ncbi:Gp15 family bacteriophage protein [Enterococcus faecalis]|uniref:Gp15 family bacteriophage protein n=1 Tax=Enterococcus faecalis TaxID=1351 RepID=UPI0002E68F10|nr:Gp15 family bacteriophage protein [Enterococcus faecalis]
MRLNDPLPSFFEFEEKEYPLNLAFDRVLDVFDVLSDDGMNLPDKVETCIKILVGDVGLDIISQFVMFRELYDTYLVFGKKSEVVTDELGNVMPMKPVSKDMDIVLDAKYIYASFRQIGINLFEEQGRLSWEEFQVLLETLPDDTPIQKIKSIRNWKPQKGERTEHKEQMRELQRRYALPNYVREEEEDG